MKPLPPPGTFAEGQRFIYGLLAAAAGMFCGACAVAMVALLMWGGWSQAEEHTIVTIFGWALGSFIVAMVAVIVGLLAGGPVGRFKVSASPSGAVIEANCADEADALTAAEQAIRLDELIKWVRAQSAVDNDGRDPSNSKHRGR